MWVLIGWVLIVLIGFGVPRLLTVLGPIHTGKMEPGPWEDPGLRTLWRPRILWGPRTCIILSIKYSVWLKYSDSMVYVNLAFSKTSIFYLMTTSTTRSFKISKLWQIEWKITIFCLKICLFCFQFLEAILKVKCTNKTIIKGLLKMQ